MVLVALVRIYGDEGKRIYLKVENYIKEVIS